MVTVKGIGTTGTKRRQDHGNYNGMDAITCATCNKKAPKDCTYHCNGCGWHNKSSVCWRCEPEQAPDTWRSKSWWMKKKAEREAATARTGTPSTTGPLHQQSGVANPNNTTDREKKTTIGTGNNKRVMSQTSNMALMAMELPDFQGGPQRI